MNTLLQDVSIGFGKVTLHDHRASIAAFRVKAPFVRDSAVTTSRRGHFTSVHSNVSAQPQIHGAMHSDTCGIPNGTIIMLQSAWMRGPAPIRSGSILLRLRDGAALLNVIANLPHGPASMLGDTYSVFRGNADILSPEEARIFKIDIPGRYIQNYFRTEEVNECFTIRQLSPEREPRPEARLVATAQGLVTTETPPPAQRRMRIRIQ